MSLQDRPKKRVAIVGVALIVTAIFLWSYLNRTKRANAPKETDASAAPITMAVQPAPVDNPNPTSPNAQRHPLVEKLLTTEAGFVNRVLAMEWVASLLSDPAACEAAISELVKSESETERILGHYLNYEKNGFSRRMADEIKADPSPYLKAETADWLYLDRHFEEREQFISAVIRNWTETEITEVLSKLNDFEGILLLPPAMRSLRLGEGLPQLITKALRDDRRVVEAAVRLAEERGMDEQGEIALLNVLRGSNPPGYENVLLVIISREKEYSHVRWKAIQDLAQMDYNVDGIRFLQNLNKTTEDRETQIHIEKMINTSTDSGREELAKLHDSVALELTSLSGRNSIPAGLQQLVERSIASRDFLPSQDILVRCDLILKSIREANGVAERFSADIDFLIWRHKN